ncbi:MAG: cell division protein ZapA [Oscillospiraceae bacterium]
MNRVKIAICGKEYVINTEESASYLKDLANTLDTKINEYVNQNDVITVPTATLLVALDLLDANVKDSSDKDNIRRQLLEYLEEATSARTEIMELKREIESLKAKLALGDENA